MRLPNFFIVGAAKAGTTSLWRYLLQHPDIFMPNDIMYKEPAFFSDIKGFRSLHEYATLFAASTTEKMIGEASTAYLTSPESPIRIKDLISDAKIIIMLRNPIDRAYSLYNWMASNGYEPVESFELALEIEKSNRFNNMSFKYSNPEYYYNYLYYHSGLYSEQVKRYFENFNREQLYFIIFEEFKVNAKQEVNKVYKFLGVDDSFVPDLKIYNSGRTSYSVPLQFFIRQELYQYLRPPYNNAHPLRNDIIAKLMKLNTRPEKPQPLSESIRNALREKYIQDVQRTSEMINKDLNHWWTEFQNQLLFEPPPFPLTQNESISCQIEGNQPGPKADNKSSVESNISLLDQRLSLQDLIKDGEQELGFEFSNTLLVNEQNSGDVIHPQLPKSNLKKKSYKVVQLCLQDYGGAGKAAYRLHKGLQHIGVDTTMLAVNKKSGDSSVKVFPSKYLGTLIHCLNVPSYVSPLWSQQLLRWRAELAKYPKRPAGLEMFTDTLSDIQLDQIKEIRESDIISLHWVAGTLDYLTAPLVLRDKQIVWTLHDMNPFTGGCHYSGNCQKFKERCGACPQLGSAVEEDLSRQIWSQKKYAFQNLDLNIVTPSKWLANCVSESSLLSGFPIKVIPYGFPLDTFKAYPKAEIRKALKISENAKVILFGADSIVNSRKGFVYLLEALKRLAPNKEHATVVLTFGNLPPGIQINTEHTIHNLGSLTDENQIALAYSAADVFVIPSLEDNLPNTVVEAMACGVPIVGFKIGGIPDMIEHKKTGFLAKPMDIGSLLEGIEWALSASESGDDISSLCRETSEKKYALEIQAKAYKELYDSLLSNQSVRSRRISAKHSTLQTDYQRYPKEAALLTPITEKDSSEKFLVSAIVSSYNSERFIKSCLENLENQTIADRLEIIVVNSGSQQNEEKIIKKFQDKYSNIKYIKTDQRETVYAAWNRGVKAATGKYITNANTDDRHRPDAMEIMVRALEENPAVGAVYAETLITDKENETFENNSARQYFNRPNFNLRQMLLFSFFGPQPMWRRSVHQRIGYFDESLSVAGDYEFFIRLAREFGALHIGEIIGLYTCRSRSIENHNRRKCVSETFQVLKDYRNTIPLEDIYPDLKSENKPEKALAACLADQGNCCLFGDLPDIESALRYYNQAFENGYTEPELTANLGVALWMSGNQTQGMELLQRISDKIQPAAHNIAIIKKCIDKGETPQIGQFEVAEIHHPVIAAASRGKGIIIEGERFVPIETVEKRWSGSDMIRKLPHKTDEIATDVSRTALVSVIVRTMNRPIFLQECLASLCAQTFKDFEVVVINDGGAKVDNIIEKYSQRLRIQYKQHPSNKGRSAALNTGLKSARGKYIAYLDDDDRIFQDHLEILVDELDTEEFLVVYSDSFEVQQEPVNGTYRTVRKRIVYSNDYDRDLLRKINYIPILNLMHHRDCADRIGLFDENLTVLEDWDYWIRLSEHYDFKHIPRVTAEYRVRSDYSNATAAEAHQFPICRERIRAKLAAPPRSPAKRTEKPLVSMVILTCNQLEYTRKCLDSVFEHRQRPFELIIVDNGSTDGTVEYLESDVLRNHTNLKIKIIKNNENKGFAGGNNQGMATANGDYILLMNNDVVVTPGWLERMLSCAEGQPEIGIVGPRSNYVSGPQRVEQIDYDTHTLKGLTEFSNEYADVHAAQAQQVLRVVGFCMLIKRAVIDKIGAMDDRYGLGNFEDDDFSLRAAIAGFQSWIARDCFIHHFGHRTFIGEKVDLNKSLLKNWSVFKEKWGLPDDKPYGSPYGLSEMKHTRFDPSIHYHPLGNERTAMDTSNNDFKSVRQREGSYGYIQ